MYLMMLAVLMRIVSLFFVVAARARGHAASHCSSRMFCVLHVMSGWFSLVSTVS